MFFPDLARRQEDGLSIAASGEGEFESPLLAVVVEMTLSATTTGGMYNAVCALQIRAGQAHILWTMDMQRIRWTDASTFVVGMGTVTTTCAGSMRRWMAMCAWEARNDRLVDLRIDPVARWKIQGKTEPFARKCDGKREVAAVRRSVGLATTTRALTKGVRQDPTALAREDVRVHALGLVRGEMVNLTLDIPKPVVANVMSAIGKKSVGSQRKTKVRKGKAPR